MIEQLSFFDNEKTEREKIFDTLVYDLSEIYQGMSTDRILQKLRGRANSGGTYKHGWLIAFWRANVEITVTESGEFVNYMFKYVDIAKAISERQER